VSAHADSEDFMSDMSDLLEASGVSTAPPKIARAGNNVVSAV
jgi:hypothetical protein